jgi:DNA-binding NtrC family response regulator
MSTHTVLIVDDEVEVLDSLRRTLRDEGYRILTAPSAAEALPLLAQGEIDLIVSDIEMPDMSGTELVSFVRRTYPDVVRILLTGDASLETAMRAINDGEVHRYLTKPWDKAVLRETIRQALDRLDELRRRAAADRLAARRELLLAELEREHPGIAQVTRDGDTYVVDPTRFVDKIDARLRWLVDP